MSLFSAEHISIMAAERLGLDETAALDLQPLIPSALNALAVEIASDPKERRWLTTDPTTTTLSIGAAGTADLQTLIDSNDILIDFLQYGNIYHPSSPYPMQWLNQTSAGRVKSEFANIFLACWAQGTTLFTRSLTNNTSYLTGDLSFAVPYVATLAQLPSSLVDDLVTTVVRLRTTQKKADAAA